MLMSGESHCNDKQTEMTIVEFRRFLEQETEQTIPQRFSQQVARFPNSPAIKTLTSSISYQELDRLSNQVANAVLHQSLGTSNTVALLFEQGADSIIAILGVLKAGKIYISLDPSSTMPDLRRIIEDCDPEVLISNEKHVGLGRELQSGPLRILSIEATDYCSSQLSSPKNMSPDSPAYIFYTSGSTGPPKGVVDSHRNVLHNVLRYTNNLQIGRKDHLSMIQGCHFSGTVSSLFSAILNGGAVCPFNLAGEGFDSLADFIIKTRVTIFHSVPTLFESLILTGRFFPGIRIVRLEGDRAEPDHIELFNRSFDRNCRLAIGLGATETGLTRQYVLSHNGTYPVVGSPIGYPVDGMEIVLVDDSGQEVNPGSPGEILVLSRYLATGYWQQPDLTDKYFLPHPEKYPMRSYRTGDMARELPDGCLLYLGRKDFRAKIRGISIETVHVELALKSHPLIERALVQVSELRRGVQQLVAYLVLPKESVLTVSEIRRYVSLHLPGYMVPARYAFLDALPTDNNGKLSRSKLPPLHAQRPALQQPYEPAKTKRQRTLVQCFEEILSLENVGIHDNFYDLGGDSLLVMQLLILVEEKTGLTFPQSKFFDSPDVATIDKYLVEMPFGASIITLQPRGKGPPLFCLHNQLGIVLHYRSLAQLLAPDIPVLGVQAANISEHNGATSIESMAAEYLPLIRERQKAGPYYLCGNCFDGLLAFEIARQLVKQGEVVSFLGLIDTGYPMGTLQAAARRVRLSESPARAFSRIIMNRFLHIFTSLSELMTRTFGHGYESQQDENAVEPPVDTNQASDLFNNRTSNLMENAGAKYRPKSYPGHVTLFHTQALGNRYGWHRVARGGFSAVQLPTGSDNHMPHLIFQPLVENLAEEIRKRISL